MQPIEGKTNWSQRFCTKNGLVFSFLFFFFQTIYICFLFLFQFILFFSLIYCKSCGFYIQIYIKDPILRVYRLIFIHLVLFLNLCVPFLSKSPHNISASTCNVFLLLSRIECFFLFLIVFDLYCWVLHSFWFTHWFPIQFLFCFVYILPSIEQSREKKRQKKNVNQMKQTVR